VGIEIMGTHVFWEGGKMTERKSRSARITIFHVILLMSVWAFWSGCTSIQDAARKGDFQEVKRQLDAGANVNSETFRMRRTALHEAAGFGHLEIVKLLLERGADPNIREESGTPPLAFAAYGGYIEIMEILIAHGAKPGDRSVMELAAKGGRVESVTTLLDHGADINVKVTDEYTPLGTAVSHRRRELVNFLLAKGANVNARAIYGATPLFVAYWNNDPVIGRILLEHGADPALECHGRKIPQSFLDRLRSSN
jgi:ankyrin repeat protein